MKIYLIFAVLVAAVVAHEKVSYENSDHLEKILRSFGLLQGVRKGCSEDSLRGAVIAFQKKNNIKAKDGELTPETIAYLKKSHCGDNDGKSNGVLAKRYNLFSQGFKKHAVNYCIFNWPTQSPLRQGDVRRAIREGLDAWEPYTPIKFTEIRGCERADFFFSFGKVQHPNWDVGGKRRDGNCHYGNAFNSAGGVLAHAFFPQNGNLHFDDNEKWTEGTDDGINLRIVTIHEMGHALGLHHSDVSGAIMQPFYGGYISKDRFRMHRDEIEAVYELYYRRRSNKRSLRNLAAKRADKPALCKADHIDSVFDYPDGYTYIIADGMIYRRNDDGIDESFAKKMSEVWQGVPKNIHASVYSPRRKMMYLFEGLEVYVAEFRGDDISELGFERVAFKSQFGFEGQASAAFGSGRFNRLFLVEHGVVYEFGAELGDMKLIKRVGKINDFMDPDEAASFPPKIDGAYSAIEHGGKEVFFFTGMSYYRGVKDDSTDKFHISADYPKKFLEDYLKC